MTTQRAETLEEIVNSIEKLKEDANGKKAILVIADEQGTSVVSHGYESVYQVIISLAVAQSAMVEQLK